MSIATRPFDSWTGSTQTTPASLTAASGECRRAVAVAREHLARAYSSLALAERCMTDLSSRLHSLQRRLEVKPEAEVHTCDQVQRQIDVAMESLTALSGTAMAAGYEADAAARCAASALASVGALDLAEQDHAPTPQVDGRRVGLLQNVAPSHLGDQRSGRLSSITRQGANSIAGGHAAEAQAIVRIAVEQMASLHDDLLQFKGDTLGPLQRQLEMAARELDQDTPDCQTIGLTAHP